MKGAALLLVPALLQAQQGAQQTTPLRFTLPNGMKVALFEDHSLPLLRGELRLALPPPAEDAQAWLRPLGFRMLEAGGSGSRSAAAFAQAADAIGLDLRLTQAPDAAEWTFAARSQDQETALALLADRLARPGFDPLALEPARSQAWNELANADTLAGARLRFARSLLGWPEPDEQILGAVDPALLSDWHRRLFLPQRATLVLWGDLDLAQARQLAMLALGAWTDQAPPKAPTTAPRGTEHGPFLASLPGEAPSVSLGLVADGTDAAARRALREWAVAQLRAGGLAVEDADEGEALVVSASAPLGVSIETLRARLAAALDALPGAFTARDFAAIQVQTANRARLRGLHPGALVADAARDPGAAMDFTTAQAALTRWFGIPNRRLFASGDPGALQGLQAPTVTPKR